MPVWLDGEDEFYNCPIAFIPLNCYELIDEYDAYKNGWAQSKFYSEYQNRFTEAIKIYEHYSNKYQIELQEKASSGEADKNLNSFR